MKKWVMLFISVFILFGTIRPVNAEEEKLMRVHFIDVGQADSILIQTPKHKNILIDGGDKPSGPKLVQYLKSHGVVTLDAIIVTHPHHDHIGSIPEILYNFKVKSFYMPNLNIKTHAFGRLNKALKEEEVMVFKAKAGDKIEVEPKIWVKIIAPLKGRYDMLNDYSYVLKLVHKENTFLLMADAGEQSETALLSNDVNVKADIIKIGHHGADTGSTLPFLKRVDPDAAIISVGRHNRYGFPTRAVINRLKYLKIPTYRTDLLGTIVAISDGKRVLFTYEDDKNTLGVHAPYFDPFGL
ncbi:beta-lactamase superfamily II metal-dependent hydrolase [Scopulibacillus darangshiensis]|uniref:Beta-lactamase superfamily II metal-dependent hydrolase n=1 Tax=Scopulibacillus darangshiensis TaxID=442528 RepID=A0A4R2P3P5_9BACL|nr:ComEC/Rec2 family competence protein [Scopulibacillus darangshiensis]TCP29312.1 beta-lactamase superfamily II metal-dependent hydrolase [Scopulibacillus darangshiensis]